ncbi:MAG: thiol reductase thioredoxin, partial [Treponema sp.]|nr:thiol reductase thioredoxin [Treponema sp.]
MSVINLNQENFEKEVFQSNVPVLVDFWASWCGPCRMVSPLVDELAEEHPEFKFCKVNVDEQP